MIRVMMTSILAFFRWSGETAQVRRAIQDQTARAGMQVDGIKVRRNMIERALLGEE